MLAGDAQSRLSDGVLVETTVLARLLGVKLLTLEGVVVLSPAHLRETEPIPSERTTLRTQELADEPRSPIRHQSVGTQRAVSSADGAVGSRLVVAEELIEDCSATLRRLR